MEGIRDATAACWRPGMGLFLPPVMPSFPPIPCFSDAVAGTSESRSPWLQHLQTISYYGELQDFAFLCVIPDCSFDGDFERKRYETLSRCSYSVVYSVVYKAKWCANWSENWIMKELESQISSYGYIGSKLVFKMDLTCLYLAQVALDRNLWMWICNSGGACTSAVVRILLNLCKLHVHV